MKFGNEESGQMLILVALNTALLFAFLALAIDVGLLFRAKRQMQVAADAAAVAGALDYKFNNSVTSAQAAGKAASTSNGVTDGTNGAVVTINVPPTSGPYTGTAGFVEAIVSQPSTTFFMSMSHLTSVRVAGRAVVGGGTSAGCIWTLARSGTDISLTGSGALSAPNCAIYDDSSSSNALTLTGSGSITGKSIGISGGYTLTGSGSLHPTPVTGIAPAADPLASLAPPTIPSGTCSSSCTQSFTGSANHTLGPGNYTSISNTGSGTLTLTAGNYIINGNLSNTGSGNLVLGAGNYTITGNFTDTGSGTLTIGAGQQIVIGNLSLTGSGTLTARGVTFYTKGTSTVTGSGSMDIEAPTSGTYDGVLFYQDRSDTHTVSVTGSGSDKIQGIFYAPSAPLTLTGSGSVSIAADFIADSISLTGSGTITDASYSALNSSTVLSRTTMVE